MPPALPLAYRPGGRRLLDKVRAGAHAGVGRGWRRRVASARFRVRAGRVPILALTGQASTRMLVRPLSATKLRSARRLTGIGTTYRQRINFENSWQKSTVVRRTSIRGGADRSNSRPFIRSVVRSETSLTGTSFGHVLSQRPPACQIAFCAPIDRRSISVMIPATACWKLAKP